MIFWRLRLRGRELPLGCDRRLCPFWWGFWGWWESVSGLARCGSSEGGLRSFGREDEAGW